jgi:hypothetical protein
VLAFGSRDHVRVSLDIGIENGSRCRTRLKSTAVKRRTGRIAETGSKRLPISDYTVRLDQFGCV